MHFGELGLDLDALPAPLPIARGTVGTAQWHQAADAAAKAGARLVSLWGSDRRADAGGSLVVSAAYALREGLAWLDLPLAAASPRYPALSNAFPAALRMQRATRDLLGIEAHGAADQRPWLDHGAWPEGFVPLRHDAVDDASAPRGEAGDYAFVRVEGDGVHEIPVGPVHAGIIEPGHFRFSIVGEKVLRLEQRLGYTHKGIERRFTELAPVDAVRLAGRVSGDSTVAFAWAYCMALESASGCTVPQRAAWLRALMLERERVANHLGDLGALGNDAAFAFGARAVLAPARGLAAPVARGLRPPADDGPRAARRRRLSTPTPRCAGPHAHAMRRDRSRGTRAAGHLRRACRRAGPLHDDRPRRTRACRAARPDGAGRPRERARRRPALRPPLAALRRRSE